MDPPVGTGDGAVDIGDEHFQHDVLSAGPGLNFLDPTGSKKSFGFLLLVEVLRNLSDFEESRCYFQYLPLVVSP